MTESFLNSLKASKSKKVEVDAVDGQPVVESDEPFFSPLILPTVDRLVYLGSQWERLKIDLRHVSRDQELSQGYRDAAKDLHGIMSDIEREYEV